jgi:hypothetical protein
LSFDLDDAAGFDSFTAGAGAMGVGEGDAAAISFGSGVGEVAGVCASTADEAVRPAAQSRAIILRVFISVYPVGVGRQARVPVPATDVTSLRGDARYVRGPSAEARTIPANDRGLRPTCEGSS